MLDLDPHVLRADVERFIERSKWSHDVPTVPSSPVEEWGTLGWARLVLALLTDVPIPRPEVES